MGAMTMRPDVRTSTPGVYVLPANQPADRFYRGGARIAAFRGEPPRGTHAPEDWIGSTTALFGADTLGLSRLPDGGLLADAVQGDPEYWLGPEHVAAFGADVGLLVKLLDAGQRLPVHAHPDVPFAGEHLGLAHGKTEAWIALEPCAVHLAFDRDVPELELRRWVEDQDVEDQDVEAMLGAMHRLELDRGDAVLVPAGLPHAIGEGAFVLELQEPTDLSILMEWEGFELDGPRDGHLGLGFETALAAVDRRGWAPSQVAALRQATAATTGPLLPGAEGFFRAERWRTSGRWGAGFAVVVVVAGQGELVDDAGAATPLHRGQALLVAHAAGALELVAHDGLEVVRCRPPRVR
jgi:mannose-6-phosphate isomerase